jgi:hypothetical protein
LAGTSLRSDSTTRRSVDADAMWSVVSTNTPLASIKNPVPSATSAVVSGAPGNIAAGPDFTG